MAGLHFDITGDNSNFIRKLHECENGVKNTSKQIEQSGLSIEDLFNRMTKAAAAFGAGFTAKELISNIAQVRGEFQQLEVAFKTMLGSEDKANALMQQLVKTAATTPFDLQGVANGAKQLLAYGENVENVNDDLIRLGNIAAGLSQPLGDIVYLYGTTMTQGRLYTQDLNQFTGRGIPMIRELAKVFGVAEGEVKSLVEAGKVGFPEVQKVIMSLTNEGGMFYNLMQEQSKTITGQISNIEDAISTMFNEIGKANEGIINDALSGVSYLVENYEKVGRILLEIVGTYGTYRTALMVTNALQALQVSGITALTAKEAVHYGWLVLTKKAQDALNISMLKNPYVLAAAAIAGLVYGIYKLANAETSAEKAVRKHREEQEKFQKIIDDRKNNIEELIRVIQDETETEYSQRKAYEELKILSPALTEAYTREELAVASLTETNKKLNEERDKQNYKNIISEIEKLTKAMKIYQQQSGLSGKALENKSYYQSLKKQINQYYEDLKEYDRLKKQAEEDAKPIEVKLLEAQSSRDEIVQEYNAAKLVLEQEQEKIKSSPFSVIPIDVQIRFDNAKSALNDIDGTISKLQNQQNKIDKTYQQAYKEAEANWKAKTKAVRDAKNKSKAEYIKAIKEQEEAEKEFKSLGGDTTGKSKREVDKQKKLQREISEELLSLRRQNQQAEIDLMEEGTEKELKQIDLDYQKELDAIKKHEKDLSERQGGKLTQEQALEISASYTNAENKRDKNIADVTKNQLKAEADAMREYLKEYGTFQQQKLAIAEEYAEKIKKAATEGEKLSLGRERDSAIQQVDINALNQKIDWQSVFGNFSGILGSQLKETLDGLKEYVNTDKFKNSSEADKKIIYEAIDRLREVTPGGEGTLNFNKIQQQMDGLGAAINRLQTATLNQDIAFQNLKKAENDYANALKTGDKGAIDSTRQALDLAKLGANAANDAYKSAEVEVQNFGNNLRDVGADTVDGLNSVASGLQSFADSTLPGIFRGLQNTLTGLSKLNIGGAVGDAIGKLSQTLSSAGVIGQIISAVLSILDILKDGIGPLISSIIDTVLNAVNGILDNILSGDMFVQIFSSIKDGIGNILNTISFGGFNSLMDKISGSNAKEVQEAIDRLTDRNETLEKSIDRLTDVMEKSAGVKSISAYEQAYKYQQEQIANTLKIAQEQARYSNSHHSWKYYMEWTDEQLRWARKNVDNNFSGTESLWGLSPEQMKLLLSNADIYEQIKSAGKGGYGGRVMEKLEAYADQAGKLDELTEKINESIMQISFDGLRDNFLESLMDMDKDAKSFSEDFSEYMQRALLNFSMGDLFDDELKAWYNGIADLMKEQSGNLTKKQIEDARKDYDLMVQKAMNERDKLAEITGYTGSSSSSSQESTKKGFAAASQDSIEELSGRFTAFQISNEEIKNQMIAVAMGINSLTNISSVGNEILNNILTQHVITNSYLDDIAKYTKLLNDIKTDISEVKSNTKGLSTR